MGNQHSAPEDSCCPFAAPVGPCPMVAPIGFDFLEDHSADAKQPHPLFQHLFGGGVMPAPASKEQQQSDCTKSRSSLVGVEFSEASTATGGGRSDSDAEDEVEQLRRGPPAGWDCAVRCGFLQAGSRVGWLMRHRSMTEYEAQLQVMSEFPGQFDRQRRRAKSSMSTGSLEDLPPLETLDGEEVVAQEVDRQASHVSSTGAPAWQEHPFWQHVFGLAAPQSPSPEDSMPLVGPVCTDSAKSMSEACLDIEAKSEFCRLTPEALLMLPCAEKKQQVEHPESPVAEPAESTASGEEMSVCCSEHDDEAEAEAQQNQCTQDVWPNAEEANEAQDIAPLCDDGAQQQEQPAPLFVLGRKLSECPSAFEDHSDDDIVSDQENDMEVRPQKASQGSPLKQGKKRELRKKRDGRVKAEGQNQCSLQ